MISFSGKALFCDVDDTLIFWEEPRKDLLSNLAKDGKLVEINGTMYEKNIKVIENLKRHFDRGHLVFVWSHGGGEWAKTAVEALGIGSFVTATMPKPDWVIDDCEQVIGQAKLYLIINDSVNG